MEINDDTLYILDKRLTELTGLTLRELVEYSINEEYKPERKISLRRIRDKWRGIRAKRAYYPKQRTNQRKIKRLRGQGY